MNTLRTLLLALTLSIVAAAPALAGDLDLDVQFSLGPSPVPSFDTASITYTGEHWSLEAGRQQIHYGPGGFGQLVVGPAIGLDGLSFSVNYAGFTYHQFWADLDGASDRRFFGHRTEYSNGGLTIGVSDTVVLAGDIPAAFYTPAPWPYILTQWFLRKQVLNANVNNLIGIDVSWRPIDTLDIYAEVLIDDYPTLPPATAPSRAGGLVGLAYRDYPNQGELRIEYTRINRYTYCHFGDNTEYVYQGAPLGHWLGPDADMLAAEYSWDARENARLSARGFLQRHGEGKLGDIWTPADGHSPIILTGEVEWSAGLRLGGTSRLSDNFSISGYVESAFVYKAEVEKIWTFRFEPPAGRLTLNWSF